MENPGVQQVNDAALATAHGGGHEVALGTSIFFAALLVAMILCLAFEEKLHAKKSVIVGVFAVATLLLGGLFGLLPFSAMDIHVGDADIHLPVYIPALP